MLPVPTISCSVRSLKGMLSRMAAAAISSRFASIAWSKALVWKKGGRGNGDADADADAVERVCSTMPV